MNRGLPMSLALGAGWLGGMLSRYIATPSVFAQAGTLKEIRTRSLVLVDSKNNIVGTFEPSADRVPTIVLLDRNGREIWRAGVSAKVLSER